MDKILKAQHEHVTKCLNGVEGPPKTKHVRGIILGTHYLNGATQFFHLAQQLDLHGNPIICYKFLFVVHKVLREGHENSVKDVIRYADLIVQLGKHWYHHQRNPYAMCIVALSKVVVQKLRFHKKYPKISGSLTVTAEQISEMTDHDVNAMYEVSLDLLDYLEEILKFQGVVFSTLDRARANSMTYEGQCRLTPLVQCVQDAASLYDLLVKLLFNLHNLLAGDTLAGHRERFYKHYKTLRLFFDQARQMQFFKNLIHIPTLPENAPNFLIQAEFSSHEAPVVDVAPEPEEEDADDLVDLTLAKQMEDELENERKRALLIENEGLQDQLSKLKAWFAEQSALLRARIRDLEEEVKRLVQHKSRLEDEIAHLRNEEFEKGDDAGLESAARMEKFARLREVYTKLRNEHVDLLRKNAAAGKEFDEAKRSFMKMEAEVKANCSALLQLQCERRLQHEKQQGAAAATESQLVSTTTALMDMERDLAQLQLQRQALQASQEQLKSLENVEADRVRQIRASNQESEIALRKLQEDVQQCSARASEARGRRVKAEEELGRIQREYDALRQRHSRYGHLSGSSLLTAACDMSCAQLRHALTTYTDPEMMNCRGSAELLLTMVDSVLNAHRCLQDSLTHFAQDDHNIPSVLSSLSELTWQAKNTLLHVKSVSNGAQSLEQTDQLIQNAEHIVESMCGWLQSLGCGSTSVLASVERGMDVEILWRSLQDYVSNSNMLRRTVTSAVGGLVDEVGDLVELEMRATDEAIEAAQRRFHELWELSKSKWSGQQLEVNERILHTCNKLMLAIKALVEKAKALQREIVTEGRGSTSTNEFYKKHHRWTEGLISAAKAIGLGANVLVKEADRVVNGEEGARPEQLEICSREITSSTVQLVVTSRVKARPSSQQLRMLMDASVEVTKASGGVVSSAKSAAEVMNQEVTFDFTHLSLTQVKKTEMESQVRVLQLESQLQEELRHLGDLRKQNYKMEEMSVAAT